MTLGELIHGADWTDVAESLRRISQGDETSLDAYRAVFDELTTLRPLPTAMRIVLREQFREGVDDEPFDELVGKDGTPDRETEDSGSLSQDRKAEMAEREVEYALEFHPWREWLGMSVDQETAGRHSAAHVIAHALHDMTFFGFCESRIAASRDEIDRLAEEVRTMTEAERREHLIPLEDVLAREPQS
ncbi:MAG: DUF6557 family protein [bacterium]